MILKNRSGGWREQTGKEGKPVPGCVQSTHGGHRGALEQNSHRGHSTCHVPPPPPAKLGAAAKPGARVAQNTWAQVLPAVIPTWHVPPSPQKFLSLQACLISPSSSVASGRQVWAHELTDLYFDGAQWGAGDGAHSDTKTSSITEHLLCSWLVPAGFSSCAIALILGTALL